MKFCYLDESGTGNEPYAVMAGVIADAYGMRITKQYWNVLLKDLSQILGKPLPEIHTKHLYSGSGPWYGLSGENRAKLITEIFNWLKERKHRIVYSAVDKKLFNSDFFEKEGQRVADIGSLWRFMALHISLSLQKCHQRVKRNKGNTVLIFDEQKVEKDEFIKLLINPPEWTDTYYSLSNRKECLNQIIDVPHFVDSRYVGLIQLADFVSFFLRRYIEIKMGSPERYKDEPKLIEEWANIALELSIPKSEIYLSKGRCDCADLFYRYAPPCILELP